MDTDPRLHRLRELIAAYGAQPARWPADERAQAEALVARSDVAKALLAEAADVDRLLDALPARAPPAGLRTRLLARAPRATPGWRGAVQAILAELGGWKLAGPALAAGLALGVGLGGGLAPAPGVEALEEDELLWLARLDDGAGYYDSWMAGL